MPKRTREPSAYPRVGNNQKFSTFRLIPVINQKNYFTNYLKKDSQYMCRKIRERPENDESQVVVLQLGSRNLRIGFSNDLAPKTLPFNVAKPQPVYSTSETKTTTTAAATKIQDVDLFNETMTEVNQSFVDRMKFYKTRIVNDAKDTCQQFNSRQQGEEVSHELVNDDDIQTELDAHKLEGSHEKTKYYCVTDLPAALSEQYTVHWPLYRGALNEDSQLYRSPQELDSDLYDILKYASVSSSGLGIKDLTTTNKYDAVLVVPDLQERTALIHIVDALYRLGYANIAIVEEAIAATYGAGISAACVVDVGAQTTTVSCVDDGACLANSRVKLDFGGDDVTRVWGELLNRIAFPGQPDFQTLDKLKQQYCTVNEADISVQLYKYINRAQRKKYDFKVYNEVMLPILGLFYPDLFTLAPQLNWRFTLFPPSIDPYTGHSNEPISDADINIRMGTLAVLGHSYQETASGSGSAAASTNNQNADDGDVSILDVDDGDVDADMSREGTPAAPAAKAEDKSSETEILSQLKAYESLDLKKPAVAALDHAIIESIAQATKNGGDAKQYYENLLVVGGGSKVPSFHAMLTDRLVMWNQSRLKDIGEVGVMAMPRDMDAESICWRGGSVYSKLKIIDEMWTTRQEWETLGSRTLHYKAALYMY